MRLVRFLGLALLMATQPTLAQTSDEIAVIKRQVKLLEDAGIDASDMRESLARMEADAARNRAPSGQGTAPPPPAEATSATRAGRWAHPLKGTWNLVADGTGTLVRDSVNGIPGRYTIILRWPVEHGNILVYTPIRNTLQGSPDSDRDEPIANPKTYRAPFEIVGGQLILGAAAYERM